MQLGLWRCNLSDGHFSSVVVVQRLGDQHGGLVAVDAEGNAVGSAVGQWITGCGTCAKDQGVLGGGFDIVANGDAA